ncbi:hypothetical protein DID75_01200 [Candidatus Marinamargulisbacteria bacterium SCGC AG-410-N11]|nr:hypothetical protein DID75_01200 [Candidatus Marinamargulisbacteria bacterium SCGC AG-410-N11]
MSHATRQVYRSLSASKISLPPPLTAEFKEASKITSQKIDRKKPPQKSDLEAGNSVCSVSSENSAFDSYFWGPEDSFVNLLTGPSPSPGLITPRSSLDTTISRKGSPCSERHAEASAKNERVYRSMTLSFIPQEVTIHRDPHRPCTPIDNFTPRSRPSHDKQ